MLHRTAARSNGDSVTKHFSWWWQQHFSPHLDKALDTKKTAQKQLQQAAAALGLHSWWSTPLAITGGLDFTAVVGSSRLRASK